MSNARTKASMPSWPQLPLRIALGLATALRSFASVHAENHIAGVAWYVLAPMGILGSITIAGTWGPRPKCLSKIETRNA